MGLDCSHNAWHGAYSAFGEWRKMLWQASGGRLSHQNIAPYGEHYVYWPDICERDWEAQNYQGIWEEYPDDPLLVLIVHADDEGIIKPDIAVPLAERLEELAPLLPAYGAGHLSPPSHPRERALQFARGLRAAAAEGKSLRFG